MRKFFYLILVLVLAAGCCTKTGKLPSLLNPNPEVVLFETLLRATAKVDTAQSVGTAFAVDTNLGNGHTLVLTAGHVCLTEQEEVRDSVTLSNPLWKEPITATIIVVSMEWDLCAMEIEGGLLEGLPIAKKLMNFGEPVYMVSDPLGQFPVPFQGRVAHENQSLGRYLYSMTAIGGVSGSAIVNAQGQVVSVASQLLTNGLFGTGFSHLLVGPKTADVAYFVALVKEVYND